jgi:hypothetical protein
MTEFDTIAVFTARSPDRIIAEGGSQAWVLNPAHARKAKWMVAIQNGNNPDHEFSDATEPHGAAFMVAKISSIKPSLQHEGRWLIEISESARIAIPDSWKWRNPVKYTSLAELGITVGELSMKPVPKPVPATKVNSPAQLLPATLTIQQAKEALAATFGVKPEAVEISIRG